MTDLKTWAKLTFELSNNRILTFDITYDDLKNKSLLEVFIEHVPMIPSSSIPQMPTTQPQKTGTTVTTILTVPTRTDIKNYIISQQNYKHSFEDITQFFSGTKELNTNDPDVIRWLNAIRMKSKRVRIEIEQLENGHWDSAQDGRNKVFTFIKNIEVEGKQSTVVSEDKQLTGEDY